MNLFEFWLATSGESRQGMGGHRRGRGHNLSQSGRINCIRGEVRFGAACANGGAVKEFLLSLPAEYVALLIALFIVVTFGLAYAKQQGDMRRERETLGRDHHNQYSAHFEVYRVYADPLKDAAHGLAARLGEFRDSADRGVWFPADVEQSDFVDYKYVSTLYRLAALLGWIRAYKRERAHLFPGSLDNEKLLNDRIDTILTRLSQGRRVEQQRALEILPLIRPAAAPRHEAARTAMKADLESIGRQVDVVMDLAGMDCTLSRAKVLVDRTEAWKYDLVRECGRIIDKVLKLAAPVNEDAALANADKLVHQLSVREAWVYRDCQQAIGDMMLKELKDAPRRFEVLGFEEFYGVFGKRRGRGMDEPRAIWVGYLDKLFSDLDMTAGAEDDARPQLIKELQVDVWNLYQELEKLHERFNQEVKARHASLLGAIKLSWARLFTDTSQRVLTPLEKSAKGGESGSP